jgi:hypothetical protein
MAINGTRRSASHPRPRTIPQRIAELTELYAGRIEYAAELAEPRPKPSRGIRGLRWCGER